MATRFYLPSSGTAPLGSLAVDTNWELTDNLERRPCDTFKRNTSLTQKSAAWTATATQQWCWVQFQSKRLATGYSWTTSDTVSMVIKVAESVAQVDSHLAYVVRVVSGDGSTIRGVIGLYHATSSEYPTSLATIATRIHDARTSGATNFSSQAGDRIIIEIGHHGVTPTTGTVYHDYGDPTATQDQVLVAGETTDYCPWVELSRTVSFDLVSSRPAYMKGSAAATPGTQASYTNGANPSYPASDSLDAYLKGQATASNNLSAYARGQLEATPGSLAAYAKGNTNVITNQYAYTSGRAYAENQLSGYSKGDALISGNISAYVNGEIDILAQLSAYLNGQANASDNRPVYIEGATGGGSLSDVAKAFILGIENPLTPDGYIGKVGTWRNEAGGESNLWTSIDETTINDSDYIWDIDPANNNYIEFSLSNPAGTPGDGDVVIFWRGYDSTGLGQVQALVQLRQGTSTVIGSSQQVLSGTRRVYYYQLTPVEKASITDWTDLRIRIYVAIA